MEKVKQLSLLAKIGQRLNSLPKPTTEESIVLRILVQLLVIIGIVATDVAALTTNSFWAIPLSIVGAVISWRRRKYQNISLKFILAIAMIVTLFLFLGNLLQNLFDNRLVLAEFLIQLQVLHSFDLPRRKDLGYSMVIGLILIGVAATLSQTLAFTPWLILFLLVAIPTMILDYRSRLNLTTAQEDTRNQNLNPNKLTKIFNTYFLSPKTLSKFTLIILALGLFIFAIMPRYQGYQLQTFPVKAPPGMENMRFTPGNRGIVNPGYDKNGQGKNNLIDGETGEGSGSVDNSSYYGFNSKMSQNLRGEMTEKKILLRVRSQAAGFWRALAFDTYTGQGWELSREDQIIDLNRHPWYSNFHLSFFPSKAATKQIIQTYTVVNDIPNIIPVLQTPKTLYFPTQQIATDAQGNLRAPAGLIEGLTYTAVSEVPYRSRTKLRQAGENYPEIISKYYLQIPPNIKAKVRKKTEELLAKSPNQLDSAYEKALFLAQALKQNYSIQKELPFFKEDEDLVEAFLFRYVGGYPDHFSTVYTMMLRSIDIPARLVVGFAPGTFNPFTGYYIVHNTDAYALTEVYFPNYGWFYFDAIPQHEIIPPSFEEESNFGILKQLWKWVAGWLPSPITAFIANFFDKIVKGFFGFLSNLWLSLIWPFISGGILGAFIGSVGTIFMAFLGYLSWNWLQKWLYKNRLAKLTPMERLYREMLDFMASKGYPKNPSQTPLEYADSFYQNQDNFAYADIIAEISNGYTLWRYANLTPNVDYLQGQFFALKRSFQKNQIEIKDKVKK